MASSHTRTSARHGRMDRDATAQCKRERRQIGQHRPSCDGANDPST
ncbi:hypothetical protein RSB1_gp01 [Ralstonia phage RSB1]|uniref:Uncharacterized protein n=1 Tax=Ralstonia phage RSB1 TaxID=551790 RepID=B5BTT7_9CAUD|nr:hypothetical protein RSB1_gp01 [Ralstonia phage RSB1]BAG70359.1 hypothetical protein [Ralstonia phage RSB1]